MGSPIDSAPRLRHRGECCLLLQMPCSSQRWLWDFLVSNPDRFLLGAVWGKKKRWESVGVESPFPASPPIKDLWEKRRTPQHPPLLVSLARFTFWTFLGDIKEGQAATSYAAQEIFLQIIVSTGLGLGFAVLPLPRGLRQLPNLCQSGVGGLARQGCTQSGEAEGARDGTPGRGWAAGSAHVAEHENGRHCSWLKRRGTR